ncbi:hypothetical protein JQ631_23965 [Bradyrhizobium manausense]|nr:hypothetical protein [Bradyrhizobium manausense]MBR0792152.1 hypothetical protein [Bradyrhizobium manausense]
MEMIPKSWFWPTKFSRRQLELKFAKLLNQQFYDLLVVGSRQRTNAA